MPSFERVDKGALELAKFFRKVIHFIGPRGFTLSGSTPWRNKQVCDGSEEFAEDIIYSNGFSSRTGKKVVYFQSSFMRNDRPLPPGQGRLILVMVSADRFVTSCATLALSMCFSAACLKMASYLSTYHIPRPTLCTARRHSRLSLSETRSLQDRDLANDKCCWSGPYCLFSSTFFCLARRWPSKKNVPCVSARKIT